MTTTHVNGITFRILGTTDRGWELAVAERHADGACWAVIHDGLSEHEGPKRTREPAGPVPVLDQAAQDALDLAQRLEGWGEVAKQDPSSAAGPN